MTTTSTTYPTTSSEYKKKQQVLPLQDVNQPYAPVTLQPTATAATDQPQTVQPQSVQPQSVAQNVSNQALQQAATTANTQDNQLSTDTAKLAQSLVADPQQGFNAENYVKSGVTQYNREAADALEAARASLVGASGSSLAQSGLLDLALETAEGRGETRNTLTDEAYQRQLDNLTAAITAGNQTAESQSDITSQNIANWLAVNTGAQSELDRAAEKELAELSAETTKYSVDKQIEADLEMQTNEMAQEEKMAYLENELENATADKDVDRQIAIIKYQADLQLKEMEAQYGYDAALVDIQGDIEKAIADGNNAAAAALQKAELSYRAESDLRDYALEEAALALEEKQVDMDLFTEQYAIIQEQIEQGLLDESAAYDFVLMNLATNGIDISKFQIEDRVEEAKERIAEEYDLMATQYAETHPEYVQSDGTLSQEGLAKFSEYYNYTMYGEESAEMEEEERTAGWITNPAELGTAVAGDMVKLDEAVATSMGALDGYGQIPAGEYSVVEEPVSTGSKFFGTKKTWVDTYLVSASGEKYRIKSGPKGAEGNIVSELWAGDV